MALDPLDAIDSELDEEDEKLSPQGQEPTDEVDPLVQVESDLDKEEQAQAAPPPVPSVTPAPAAPLAAMPSPTPTPIELKQPKPLEEEQALPQPVPSSVPAPTVKQAPTAPAPDEMFLSLIAEKTDSELTDEDREMLNLLDEDQLYNVAKIRTGLPLSAAQERMVFDKEEAQSLFKVPQKAEDWYNLIDYVGSVPADAIVGVAGIVKDVAVGSAKGVGRVARAVIDGNESGVALDQFKTLPKEAQERVREKITARAIADGILEPGERATEYGLGQMTHKEFLELVLEEVPDAQAKEATKQAVKVGEQWEAARGVPYSFLAPAVGLPENLAWLGTKIATGGTGAWDKISESTGLRTREDSFENWRNRRLVDAAQSQFQQENPTSYHRVLQLAAPYMTSVVRNSLPSVQDYMEMHGVDEKQARILRDEDAEEATNAGIEESAKTIPQLDQQIMTAGEILTPGGFGLDPFGYFANLYRVGSWLTPKLYQTIETLGMTDDAVNAMRKAQAQAAKAKEIKKFDDRMKPTMTFKVASKMDEAVKRMEQRARDNKFFDWVRKNYPYLGGLTGVGYDTVTKTFSIDPWVIAGIAGLKAAGSSAIKLPELVARTSEARRLAAGGRKGTFATMADILREERKIAGKGIQEAEDISQRARKDGLVSRVQKFNGKKLDDVLDNLGEYARMGIEPTMVGLATGLLDSADADELSQILAQGLVWTYLPRASQQIWKKASGGVDPILEMRRRRQDDQDMMKTYRDSTPETKQSIDFFANHDRIIERQQKIVADAETAFQEANNSRNPEAIVQAQKNLTAQKAVLRQAMRANAQTRNEVGKEFLRQLARNNMMVNGTMRSGQNNVGIHILTTQQIIDHYRKNPEYQNVPIDDLNVVASQRGFYSNNAPEATPATPLPGDPAQTQLIFDKTKPSVVINADSLARRMTSYGELPTDALNHEIGHALEAIPEFREANAETSSLLFAKEVKDLNGNVVHVSNGYYTPKMLVQMYMDNYLGGLSPEEKVKIAQLNGNWDYNTNNFNEGKIARYMESEVLADVNAATISRHVGKDLNDAGRHMLDLAMIKSQKNLLEKAVSQLRSLGGSGDIIADNTGARFSPEIMAASRIAFRRLQGLNEQLSKADRQTEAPLISKAEMYRNNALLQRYGKNSGLFKVNMVASVFDAQGNPVGKPIVLTNPLEGGKPVSVAGSGRVAELLDLGATEGEWKMTDTGLTRTDSGYGGIPKGIDPNMIPAGGRLVVSSQVQMEADGKTPKVLSPKEAKQNIQTRGELLRAALDTPDYGASNRFEPVTDGSLTWRGAFTPLQIEAIRNLPESIVPRQIKDYILRINDMVSMKDGTRMIVDYAAVMNDRGRYQAFSPKLYDLVPISMHLSKDGNFLATTISVSRLLNKLSLWSERMPRRLDLWNGSTELFWNEFTNKYLKNWQEGKDGEDGLDTDPVIAKEKKEIFNDFLNLVTKDTINENKSRTQIPKRRGDPRAKDLDRTIMSVRIDHIAELLENPNAEKVPVDYWKAVNNLMVERPEVLDRIFPGQTKERGFFSKLQRTIGEKVQGKAGTADQIRAVLGEYIATYVEKQPDGKEKTIVEGQYPIASKSEADAAVKNKYKGQVAWQSANQIKADEVKWTGVLSEIDRLAAENDGMVPKDALIRYLQNEGAVEFVEKRAGFDPEADKMTEEMVDRLAELEEANAKTPLGAINDTLGDGTFDELLRLQNIRDKSSFDSLQEGYEQMEDLAIAMQNEAKRFPEGSKQRKDAEAKAKRYWTESSHFTARQEALELQDAGIKSPTRYSKYSLPGGENYYESVLTLPYDVSASQASVDSLTERMNYLMEGGVELYKRAKTDPEAKEEYDRRQAEYIKLRDERTAIERKVQAGKTGEFYTSRHFPDTPGYVAHMRVAERSDNEGNPGLFSEEFQSDLHQEARKEGYASDFDPVEIIDEMDRAQLESILQPYKKLSAAEMDMMTAADMKSSLKELAQSSDGDMSRRVKRSISTLMSGGLPNAPFRKDWPLQMFKRLLRDAVDQNKGWVGWADGETQANRYDLSKQVKALLYKKRYNGYYIDMMGKSRNANWQQIAGGVAPEQLPGIVGKEIADKIIAGEGDDIGGGAILRGVDLKVGGEGMKSFYDKMLPKEVSKYIKSMGGSVTQDVFTIPANVKKTINDDWVVLGKNGEPTGGFFDTYQDALAFHRELNLPEQQVSYWKVNLTPQMKSAVSVGQTQFMPEKPSREERVSRWSGSYQNRPGKFTAYIAVAPGKDGTGMFLPTISFSPDPGVEGGEMIYGGFTDTSYDRDAPFTNWEQAQSSLLDLFKRYDLPLQYFSSIKIPTIRSDSDVYKPGGWENFLSNTGFGYLIPSLEEQVNAFTKREELMDGMRQVAEGMKEYIDELKQKPKFAEAPPAFGQWVTPKDIYAIPTLIDNYGDFDVVVKWNMRERQRIKASDLYRNYDEMSQNPNDSIREIFVAENPFGTDISEVQMMPERAVSEENIKAANRTARAAGAVGARAITPRYVSETIRPGELVLNFGAGKPNTQTGKYDHSELIRNAGAEVYEYDFGDNSVGNLGLEYDTVFASNVLNVQGNEAMLNATIGDIWNSVMPGGRAVMNYPSSPRYVNASAQEVASAIQRVTGQIPERVGGTGSAPLWEIRKQKTGNEDYNLYLSGDDGNTPIQAGMNYETWMEANPISTDGLMDEVRRQGSEKGFTEVVYHGDRNQPLNPEYQKWTSAKLPLFTTYDREGADWFGNPIPLLVKADRMASMDDVYDAARAVGVEGTYGDPREETYIPEVSNHSPYEGTNPADLVYIPKVRQKLIDNGFDSVRLYDVLENSDIDTLIVLKSPNQVKSGEAVTFDSDGNIIPPAQRFDSAVTDLRFMPERERKERPGAGITFDDIARLAQASEGRGFGFDSDYRMTLGVLYDLGLKDPQWMDGMLGKLNDTYNQVLDMVDGSEVDPGLTAEVIRSAMQIETGENWQIPVYVYAPGDKAGSIGLLANKDGELKMFEGNDEASPETIDLANKLLGIGDETIKVWSSQPAEIVKQIRAGNIPDGIYVSPNRNHAAGYWGEGRELVSLEIPRSRISQESEVDWRVRTPQARATDVQMSPELPELFRAGQSPDDYDGKAPRFDWDQSDNYGGKWDEDSVATFAGAEHNFIYPAMIDAYDLKPQVVELENANDIEKMSEAQIRKEYADEFIDDENADWREVRERMAESQRESWDSYKSEFGQPFGRGYPPVVVRRADNGTFELLDGNHRTDVWQEQGFDVVPAWVVDDYLFTEDAKRKKISGVPFMPEKVDASTSVAALRKAEEFDAAKYRGSATAAMKLVDRFVKPDLIASVRAKIDPNRPAVVVPVIAKEGESLNAIPLAMAKYVADSLGVPIWFDVSKTSSMHNTDAKAVDRARNAHVWEGNVPSKDTQVIIVDDTYTTGQTLKSLASFVGDPAAIVTLSSGRYGKDFELSPQRAEKVLAKAGLSDEEFIDLYGQPISQALTGSQAQQYILNGAKGREGLISRFPLPRGEESGAGNAGLAGVGAGKPVPKGAVETSEFVGLDFLPEKDKDPKFAKIIRKRFPSGIRTLSYFSGLGTWEMGLGGIIVPRYAAEYDPHIAAAYRAAIGEHLMEIDITKIDPDEIFEELDYFHGSPVCKNYSLLKAGEYNRKKSTGKDADLDMRSAEAVTKVLYAKQPEFFTAENVREYQNSEAMDMIREALSDLGYNWDEGIYNAYDYGAATDRKRLIVRATKSFELPVPEKVQGTSWYEAIKDLIPQLPSDKVKGRNKVDPDDNYIFRSLREQGIDPLDVPEPLLVPGGGAFGQLDIRTADRPAFTFKASTGVKDRLFMPGGVIKRLTAQAKARISGIPESYKLPDNENLAQKMIGNGVPPPLVRQVVGPMLAQTRVSGIPFAVEKTKKFVSQVDEVPDVRHQAGSKPKLPKQTPARGYYNVQMQSGAGGNEPVYKVDLTRVVNPDVDDPLAVYKGERVGILESDRHDSLGDRMAGVLYPYLLSNQVVATTKDGQKYKPMWSNLERSMVTKSLNTSMQTTRGTFLVHMMTDFSHISNKKFATDVAQDIDAKVKSGQLTQNQIDGLHVIIDIGSKDLKATLSKAKKDIEKAQEKLKSASTPAAVRRIEKTIADRKQEIKDINDNYKDALKFFDEYLNIRKYIGQKNNEPKFPKSFDKLIEKYSGQPWFQSIVKQYKDVPFYWEARELTFPERGAAMEALHKLPFVTSILQKLDNEADFRGANNTDLVASVQLSQNPDAFGIYTGEKESVPKGASDSLRKKIEAWNAEVDRNMALMTPTELDLRKQFMSNPKFKPHPSYHWMMIGPADAKTFIFDKTLDPLQVFPSYAQSYNKVKKKNPPKARQQMVNTMKWAASDVPLIMP